MISYAPLLVAQQYYDTQYVVEDIASLMSFCHSYTEPGILTRFNEAKEAWKKPHPRRARGHGAVHSDYPAWRDRVVLRGHIPLVTKESECKIAEIRKHKLVIAELRREIEQKEEEHFVYAAAKKREISEMESELRRSNAIKRKVEDNNEWLDQRCASLEDRLRIKQEEMDELGDQLREARNEKDGIVARLEESEMSLTLARGMIDAADQRVHNLQNTRDGLMAEVTEKSLIIAEWEEAYNQLSEQSKNIRAVLGDKARITAQMQQIMRNNKNKAVKGLETMEDIRKIARSATRDKEYEELADRLNIIQEKIEEFYCFAK